jgi:hypothetical protein
MAPSGKEVEELEMDDEARSSPLKEVKTCQSCPPRIIV